MEKVITSKVDINSLISTQHPYKEEAVSEYLLTLLRINCNVSLVSTIDTFGSPVRPNSISEAIAEQLYAGVINEFIKLRGRYIIDFSNISKSKIVLRRTDDNRPNPSIVIYNKSARENKS